MMYFIGRTTVLAQCHPVLLRSCMSSGRTLNKIPNCHPCSFSRWPVFPLRSKMTFTRKPRQFNTLQEKDNIPAKFEMVFVNNMNAYYLWGQVGIYVLMLPTVCFCGYLIWSNGSNLQERLKEEQLDHPYVAGFAGLTVSTLLLLMTNTICRRAVIRMYHNADANQYIAVTQKWNMMREHIKFTPNDCEPLSKLSTFSQNMFGSNIKIKGRQFLINDTDFRQPWYYNDLMGWQRAEEDRSEKIHDSVTKYMRKKRSS